MSRLMIDDPQPRQPDEAKFLLATTVYDDPDVGYTFSIQKTIASLRADGFNLSYLLLSGNCHVDDARNSVVRHFLDTDASFLVFIDADVVWEPSHMEALLNYAKEDGIVGGVYPYRRAPEDWPPEMPVRMKAGATPVNGLLEVEGLPTGFMAIGRNLVEVMAEDAETFATKTQENVPRLFYRRLFRGGQMGGDIGFCFDAREKYGAKCYALPDLRLGHVGKHVIRASLSHVMRMRNRQSLKHVCDRIAAGEWTLTDLTEILEDQNNRWGAREDALSFCVAMAKKHGGPILEMGSGLSTVLMAAALPEGQRVFAFEHDEEHALRTKRLAMEGGVADRVAIVRAHLINRWYDRSDFPALPDRFTFAFVDGPPRYCADRSIFFEALGSRCDAVVCDDAPDFQSAMVAYAGHRGWQTLALEGRAMIIGKDEQ